MTCKQLQTAMRKLANPIIAEHSKRFFKTGKGEYGEGDLFLGVRVGPIRALAKKHPQIKLTETLELLHSSYHEERLLAVIIMVRQFEKSDKTSKSCIYKAYINNTKLINNWDLVDSSAHQIVGGYLLEKKRNPLYSLCRSSNLWERRISIIATLHFIRLLQFDDTLAIAEKLLLDKEDLIHKASGWMLREVGNRNRQLLIDFLAEHYQKMPRTMLRYSIEKLEPELRKSYLKGEI